MEPPAPRLLLRALKLLGANAGFHIPHRFTEGYGIQQAALEKAFADGYKLVVSIDCGIRAHEPLYWARDNGLDVIITDHHLPDEKEGAPPAFAVLNPNQAGCEYPDKNLAGVASLSNWSTHCFASTVARRKYRRL